MGVAPPKLIHHQWKLLTLISHAHVLSKLMLCHSEDPAIAIATCLGDVGTI